MPTLKPGFGKLAMLFEVFTILEDHVPVLETERVGLGDALHRVLAEDVQSRIDVPHFQKSAMDGYAVMAADTFHAADSTPKVLQVVESVTPGRMPEIEITSGSCTEIGTGAPMPLGADAVVMVEYTEAGASEGWVQIRKPVAPGENLVEVGSDVAAGTTILKGGTWLEPRHLGALAAVGLQDVPVRRRLKVALFSTGPELLQPGSELEPGRIFDINSHTLRGALAADGCEVVDLGLVPDELGPLESALQLGLEKADLVLLSGGSSLGGGDLVVEAFEHTGELILHGVAVKPGKPVVMGRAENQGISKMMIGLPGYPMSALSDYYIFVQWFIRRAYGMTRAPVLAEATISRKHASTVGRYEFLPVRLEAGMVTPLTKSSSSISALAEADGFVEIEENVEVIEKGDTVRVRMF